MRILRATLTGSLPLFAETLDDLNTSSDDIYDAGTDDTINASMPIPIKDTLIGALPTGLVSGFGIRGTEFADTLDDLSHNSSGGAYDPGTNDTINALGGHDIVRVYNGNDTVNGGEGDDQIYDLGTDEGDDVMNGEGGDDTFYIVSGYDTSSGHDIWSGTDTVNGGTGTDWVSYRYTWGWEVHLDLEDGSAGSQGYANLISIENAEGTSFPVGDDLFGSSAANTLVGLDGNDEIQGRGGDDWLRGDGGNDFIYGGEGNDTIEGGSDGDTIDGGSGADFVWAGLGHDRMTGGADADTFYFASWSDFESDPYINLFGAFECDGIKDFEQGVDKIDVSAIDARPDIAGDQAFRFDATPDGLFGFGGLDQLLPDDAELGRYAGPLINADAGEIEYRHEGGYTFVYLSPGDQYKRADIVLEGYITLTASDFIL
jgi:Ca2+-binding RTX toxin-like protein